MTDIQPTPLPHATWRLIVTPPARGAWNMAVDEAILLCLESSQAPSVLRLYDWTPPCLSLGYAQPASDVELSHLETVGWDLVRRPTGGRAILHTDELTYSVIAPVHEPRLAGGVLESYQRLSGALLASLQILGVAAESKAKTLPTPVPGQEPNSPSQNPVCFEVPSNYEITAGGKKLIGSAQARKKEGVLQHGSIPLHGDLTRIVQALHFSDELERQTAAARLLSRATTIQEILGETISWDQAIDAFTQGFKSALNLDLIPSELSDEELELAGKLVDDKYANPSWTYRV